MTLLAVHQLVTGHPGGRRTQPFSFSLQAPQALAVLGPNGSGKTTLLRTLLGLIPPLAGDVRWHDMRLNDQAPAQLARQIAYVPQVGVVLPGLSVYDVVLMARASHHAWYAAPGAHDREVALVSLERLGIADLAHRDINQLSGGERQLVLIARALATEARTLLLDEPAAHLDFGHQIRVLDQLEALVVSGVSMVFSTHHPDQAQRLAEQTLTIALDGEVCLDKTMVQTTANRLAALYGVKIARIPAGMAIRDTEEMKGKWNGRIE